MMVTPEGSQSDSTEAEAEGPTQLLLPTHLMETERKTIHQVKLVRLKETYTVHDESQASSGVVHVFYEAES